MEDDSAFTSAYETLEQLIQSGVNVDLIVDFMMKTRNPGVISAIESADAQAVSYAREHNLDVLTSDTTGSRTIVQLQTTRPFWLGLASQCVAVAIVNARVGIAGAHFRSSTEEDVRSGYKMIVTSGKEKAMEEVRKMKTGGHTYLMESLVPTEHRVERLVAAVRAASDLYDKLERKVGGRSRPWACITGLAYGTEKDKEKLRYHAEKALKKMLRDPIMDLRIGLAGGVVYGGPNSKFPEPQIIT